MAAGDFLKAALLFHGPGNELFVNTFHYLQALGAGTPAVTQMDALAAAIEAALVPTALTCISSSVTYDECVCTILTGTGAAQIGFSSDLGGQPGTSSGTPGPVERAVIFRKITGLAGRKFRGRIFLPVPCVEAFDNDGVLSPGNPDATPYFNHIAAMVATIDISAIITGGSLAPVVFHRSTNTGNVVISGFVSQLVGIQRRRRLGIGV
jgi:hypothetical protein